MDRYTEIYDALIKGGISEDTSTRLAEFINDAGLEEVRDILNTLDN